MASKRKELGKKFKKQKEDQVAYEFSNKRPDFGSPIPISIKVKKDSGKKTHASTKRTRKDTTDDYETLLEFSESEEFEPIETARDASIINIISKKNKFLEISQGLTLTPKATTSFKRQLKTGLNSAKEFKKKVTLENDLIQMTSTPVSNNITSKRSLNISAVCEFEGDSDIPLCPNFEKELNSEELMDCLISEETPPSTSRPGEVIQLNNAEKSEHKNTQKRTENAIQIVTRNQAKRTKTKTNQSKDKTNLVKPTKTQNKLKTRRKQTENEIEPEKLELKIVTRSQAKRTCNTKTKTNQSKDKTNLVKPTKTQNKLKTRRKQTENEIEPEKLELSYSQEKKQMRKKRKSKFSPLLEVGNERSEKDMTNLKKSDEIEECCLKYLYKIKIRPFVVSSKPALLTSPLDHFIPDDVIGIIAKRK